MRLSIIISTQIHFYHKPNILCFKTANHSPFTTNEIRKIFGLSGRDADVVKCLILTGCRPTEVMNLPDDAFCLNGDIPYIVTGSKTEAGKNRVVPIHPAITDAVKSLIG